MRTKKPFVRDDSEQARPRANERTKERIYSIQFRFAIWTQLLWNMLEKNIRSFITKTENEKKSERNETYNLEINGDCSKMCEHIVQCVLIWFSKYSFSLKTKLRVGGTRISETKENCSGYYFLLKLNLSTSSTKTENKLH